jgi:hypothetical protein
VVVYKLGTAVGFEVLPFLARCQPLQVGIHSFKDNIVQEKHPNLIIRDSLFKLVTVIVVTRILLLLRIIVNLVAD